MRQQEGYAGLGEVANESVEQIGPASGADFVYVDIRSIDREQKTIATPQTIPVDGAPSRAKQRLRTGDVLVSMTRPNLNAVAIVPANLDGAIGSTGFHVLRSKHMAFKYLYFLVQSQEFVDAMCAVVQGALYPAVRPGDIYAFAMRVPAYSEQTRIVEKLEELLSDLNAGVAELKAAQKKLAQYRQSLLKAAIEGRLTDAWRVQHREPEESGAQLLARILRYRRARWEAKQLAKFQAQGKSAPNGWQAKYVEPATPDAKGLSELPQGWVWATLDMLIDDGPQNGLYLPGDRYGRGCPILRIDDFQNDWARPREELNRVDADGTTLATYSLHAGDLVVNRVNSMTHLGKTLVIDSGLDGALFESNLMRFKLSGGVNPLYVGSYLGSEIGRKRLIRDAKWAVNQASINQQDVKRTPIPLAPHSEQAVIVEVLRDALSSSEDQLQAVTKTLRQSAAQRKNILQAAFSGRLVPQDPNDEPASVLLERIRAERMNQPAQSRKPRVSRKAP